MAGRNWLPRGRVMLLALFALLILGDFFLLHGLDGLEHPVQDALVRAYSVDRAPDTGVVVVDVDERSLLAAQQHLGAGWPWPRSLYADLLQGLYKQHPKALSI